VTRPSQRPLFAARASLAVAALVAVASLVGIMAPSTIYARETAPWRLQGEAQDWIDLLAAVPWLAASAIATGLGSRRARLVLAGGLVYVLYTFVIYAFAVHFNGLFLVYCAVLGLSVFALASLGRHLLASDVDAWFGRRAPRRLLAGYLIGSAILFGGLWLAKVVPALVSGQPPPELAEHGLITNPVHVLDLSLVLPLMLAGGLAAWRRRPIGLAVALPMLGFAALMNLTITALTVALDGPAAVSAVLGVFTIASSALLVIFLQRAIRTEHGA
jgi:hypothetical protein